MLRLAETIATVGSLAEAALSLVYPDVCQFCGEEGATRKEGYIGPVCRANVQLIERPFCERCGLPFQGAITTVFECSNCRDLELRFSKARSAALAEGMLLELIHRYKYNRELWLEPFLAGILMDQAAAELRREHWDLIVPVPLHRLKQGEREFNQAERLARCLSDETLIPLQAKLLRRIEPTRTQTKLTRRERVDNVRKAFALRPEARLNGERIVLIDDVLTTGATSSACAKALLDANASEVCVWTLARGGMK